MAEPRIAGLNWYSGKRRASVAVSGTYWQIRIADLIEDAPSHPKVERPNLGRSVILSGDLNAVGTEGRGDHGTRNARR